MKKYLTHIIWAVVAIVAFVGGMYYGKSTASPFGARGGAFAFGSSTRGTALGGNRAGGGFTTGEVVSKDAQSITLQLPNGNSEIVFYSTSTSVIVPSPASMSDIQPGTAVVVGGTQNSDGSLTAQTIQVRAAASQSGGPTGGVMPM